MGERAGHCMVRVYVLGVGAVVCVLGGDVAGEGGKAGWYVSTLRVHGYIQAH
jgi:hypothetical protein